jgi:hypothetical protein
MATKEKSPLAKATEKARLTLKAAKAANEKSDNAATQKTLATAKADLETAQAAERIERFKRVGGTRVANARKAIGLLKALTNVNSYIFTPEQVKKVTDTLAADIAHITAHFEEAAKSPAKVKGGKKVAFEL